MMNKIWLRPFRTISIIIISMVCLPSFLFNQTLVNLNKDITNFSLGFGARAMGMGGAFISIADDATAASWNPAGLAQLMKAEISLSSSFFSHAQKYPEQNYQYDGQVNYPDMGWDSYYYFNDQNKRSGLGIDFVSFVLPLQLGSNRIALQACYQRIINNFYNETYEYNLNVNGWNAFEGNFSFDGSRKNERKSSKGYDNYSFSVAAQFFKNLLLGISFNLWAGGQHIEEDYYKNSDLYSLDETEISISGFNFNVGVLVKLGNRLHIGGYYKNMTTTDVEFTNQQDLYTRDERIIRNGEYKIRWPYALGFGVSYRPTDQLTIALDLNMSNWSKAKQFEYLGTQEVYQSDIHQYTVHEEWGTESAGPDTEVPFPDGYSNEDFKYRANVTQIRIGIEYIILSGNNVIPLRLGFYTNPSFQKPKYVENKTIHYGFTVGSGISLGNLIFDIAYVFETARNDCLTYFNYYYDNGIQVKSSEVQNAPPVNHRVFVSAIYRFGKL